MKKFKFILPVLAFVMAITLAFAVPSETATTSKVQTSILTVPAITPPAFGCVSCGNTNEDNCSIENTGVPCTCEGGVEARSPQNCNQVLKRPE